MDILEFVKERDRMCDCYYDKRSGACSCSCPAISINCRSFDTEEVNKLIPIVEKWSKDYPNKTNSKIYSEDYKNTVDKTGISPKQKTIINVDPEIEGIVKRYVLECVQVLKGEVCKSVNGNESASENYKIENCKRDDKPMFTVKVKPENKNSYNLGQDDFFKVYDVEYDGYGKVKFLIYNTFWKRWEYVPANHFEPLEDEHMKITVEHEIPYDKDLENRCEYAGDFWGNQICKYHVNRNRTHGRKSPPEYKVPKCTLFDKWLDGECMKCPECLEAVRKAMEE